MATTIMPSCKPLFATLNCAIIDEEGNPRCFAASKSGRDTRNLYRYKEMFQQKEEEILTLFAHVPFLNGGLFECLDKPKDLYLNQEYDIFMTALAAMLPNHLMVTSSIGRLFPTFFSLMMMKTNLDSLIC